MRMMRRSTKVTVVIIVMCVSSDWLAGVLLEVEVEDGREVGWDMAKSRAQQLVMLCRSLSAWFQVTVSVGFYHESQTGLTANAAK
jgi:hypothetical protein